MLSGRGSFSPARACGWRTPHRRNCEGRGEPASATNRASADCRQQGRTFDDGWPDVAAKASNSRLAPAEAKRRRQQFVHIEVSRGFPQYGVEIVVAASG